MLSTAGERAEKTMLILDGTVKVVSAAPNQREVILDILGLGDLIAEEAVAEERNAYGASVVRDTVVFSMPAAAIRALLARSPEFAMAWIRGAYTGKRRLQERVTELAYGNIEDRLSRILAHLMKQHGVKTTKGNTMLRFPLTHQELANMIGATRETTTVAVGRLRSAGVIGFRERKIILKEKVKIETPQEEKLG
jgi:CRP-like cAMP-binding protein